jgi:tetratricopeptide (TPR) repeat protein
LSWEPFHKQEQAIVYLQQALEYDPANVETRFWLAACYYHDFCDSDEAKKMNF